MESIIGISYHLVYSDPTVKSFNDDQLCWRCYAICFRSVRLALHHIIDCWAQLPGRQWTLREGGQGGATNYVVSARLQRRTQLEGDLKQVEHLQPKVGGGLDGQAGLGHC